MPTVDKRALIAKLCEDITAAIAVNTRAAHEAREAATHDDAKPENDKDTRAVEAAYLAGAQAERVRDLERVRTLFMSLPLRNFGPGEAISASALIEIEQGGATHHYFLAPQGGGLRASIEGIDVQVITPQSVLGRELLGKSEGDAFEVTLQGCLRTYEIVRVL